MSRQLRPTQVARDLATPPPDTLLEVARDIVYFTDQAGMADDNWRHRLGKLRQIVALADYFALACQVSAAQPVEGPRPITPNLYLDEPEMVDALRSKGYQVIAPVEGVERVTDDAPARVEPPKKPEGCICPWSKQNGIVFEDNPYCTVHHPEPAAQPAKHTDEEAAFKIAVQAVDVPYYEDRHGDVYVLARGFLALRGRAETRVEVLEAALRLYAKYAPFSGDMALMIRASQAGGQEAAERADKLVEHYSHLDEAHDAARAALAALPQSGVADQHG